jgi:hypothetical protein
MVCFFTLLFSELILGTAEYVREIKAELTDKWLGLCIFVC